MNLNEIWAIVLGVLTSVGGIGVIILAIVKFSSNIIAKRLEEKYSLKLNKELEKYKSSLENKIYISKAKFDAEFSIYRELSKAFFEMEKGISIMIPSGIASKPVDSQKRKEYEEMTYTNASKAVVLAQDTLNSNAPFISYSIFEKYNHILELCRMQLNAFEARWNVMYIAPPDKKEDLKFEDYLRTVEINKEFKALNENIREYLAKLDVL